MASLRHIHRLMNERRSVVLGDGRVGKITRLDTFFPKNETIVTIWLRDITDSGAGSPPSSATGIAASGLVKVGLDDVVGPAAAPPPDSG